MANTNPFHSTIKNIYLGDIDGLNIIQRNEFCQFEKIEFAESLLDLYPQGSITVRDTSDIMTYMSTNNWDYVTIEYENQQTASYFVTNFSYINNAASSNEENMVVISFSNYLFKLAQNTSVSQIMTSAYPQVYKIDKFLSSKLINGINQAIPDPYTKIQFNNDNIQTSNYMVYRPINPLDDKSDISSENIIQYMYYVTSLACDSENSLPRFLFWTSFDNSIYLKYMPETYKEDPNYDSSFKNRLYSIYESDSPTLTIQDNQIYKKIYQFKSNPATQYYNRKYYYTRITPKILNTESTTDQEQLLFNHQYLDNGSRYDTEIITSDGVVDVLPSGQGISSFEYKRFYGYYTKHDVDNNFKDSGLLSMEYGVRDLYDGRQFLSVVSPYPFVDSPEMWKNVYDLTPLHPNLGSQNTDTSGENTNLQKIYQIRNTTKASLNKLDQIKEIEKQNFILYVLCCIKEVDEQEETFFARITGWTPDTETGYSSLPTGYNNEPLIYRYSWKRLEINIDATDPANGFVKYTTPEHERWATVDEGSTDDITTWAINLNERRNQHDYGQGSGYYAPGWYGLNLTQSLFDYVNYRPIGNRTGGLTTEESTPIVGDYHIVRMTKVPFSKIIKQAKNYSSVITDDETLQSFLSAAAGKYLYYFEMANITDGPCNTLQNS
jgi:hypothetical protein